MRLQPVVSTPLSSGEKNLKWKEPVKIQIVNNVTNAEIKSDYSLAN